MNKREFSPKEIADALLLCRNCANSDGRLCNLCPYSKYTSGCCSDRLLDDASKLIREELCSGGDSDGD